MEKSEDLFLLETKKNCAVEIFANALIHTSRSHDEFASLVPIERFIFS